MSKNQDRFYSPMTRFILSIVFTAAPDSLSSGWVIL
jgi:hypothetical protein